MHNDKYDPAKECLKAFAQLPEVVREEINTQIEKHELRLTAPMPTKGKNMNKHTPTPWHVTNDGDVAAIVDGVESLLADTLTHQSINRFNHRENAEHIVRCVNSHEALLRIAELVQHAVLNRADRDWTMMHMDLSEAAELAKQVAPIAAAGAPQ